MTQDFSTTPKLLTYDKEDFSLLSIKNNHEKLHTLFEEQAKINPNDIAIVYKNSSMTFEELNQRSNQLANYLRKSGIKQNEFVGVYLERSIESVISFLAILKTGAICVPLDLVYPAKRLSHILEETKLFYVITSSYLNKCFPKYRKKLINLDKKSVLINQMKKDNLPISSNSQNTAFVIYTSGSTGKPKGVFLNHYCFLNKIKWIYSRYPFKTVDVCCHSSSLGVVISISEIFTPLLSGIKVVILPEKAKYDFEEFID